MGSGQKKWASSGNSGAVVEEGQQRVPPVVNSQEVPDLSTSTIIECQRIGFEVIFMSF
ncbi:hypothetical protein HanRHA438_Chr07g0320321 [Helianthus annuus]|nr:hypothetical protein HanRHA438_Chr07g0320321 [Helianthus annuus]